MSEHRCGARSWLATIAVTSRKGREAFVPTRSPLVCLYYSAKLQKDLA
jgi:hypothetical protein